MKEKNFKLHKDSEYIPLKLPFQKYLLESLLKENYNKSRLRKYKKTCGEHWNQLNIYFLKSCRKYYVKHKKNQNNDLENTYKNKIIV